jgi:hypothetical protein
LFSEIFLSSDESGDSDLTCFILFTIISSSELLELLPLPFDADEEDEDDDDDDADSLSDFMLELLFTFFVAIFFSFEEIDFLSRQHYR